MPRLSKLLFVFPTRKNLAASRRISHADQDGAAADVAVFDVLDGFVGGLWFYKKRLAAVGARD